ncbi:hypothetical protein [Pseudomonas sp. NPDC085632]
MPVLPILRSDNGRWLPQTFRGGQITWFIANHWVTGRWAPILATHCKAVR